MHVLTRTSSDASSTKKGHFSRLADQHMHHSISIRKKDNRTKPVGEAVNRYC